MLVEDLFDFLVDRGFNQLATDVNRAAGLYADAMADAEGDLSIKDHEEQSLRDPLQDPVHREDE